MSWRSQGLRAWLLQRVSAVYMAFYVVFFLFAFALNHPDGYFRWRAFLGAPLMNIATILFFLALLAHAWVGMRDIVLDYVKPWSLRFIVLTAVAGILMTMGVWVVRILLVETG